PLRPRDRAPGSRGLRAAARAERVIVARGLAVVTARAVAERDLAHEARLFQITQRVIDRGVRERRANAPRRRIDFGRRQMLRALAHDPQDHFSLRGERTPATLNLRA